MRASRGGRTNKIAFHIGQRRTGGGRVGVPCVSAERQSAAWNEGVHRKGKLDDVGSKLSADDIHAWIVDAKGMTAKTKATRKPDMKQYTLPKDDVDALVAYLSSLKK
jgi:hypothetical protein